ncbi:hypothetical protein [Faecalicatena contorta]|uniref:hypothetical protein n=1 Tax=Faecalicatena contorta TaxID=39482 RepID=UPI002EA52C81|nr:hypothetical protein [Muricomes sp.]
MRKNFLQQVWCYNLWNRSYWGEGKTYIVRMIHYHRPDSPNGFYPFRPDASSLPGMGGEMLREKRGGGLEV